MQVSIDVEGSSALAETAELRAWLHEARIREIDSVRQEEQPPKPGEQGPTLLAILTVVLAGRATVELVRSIHRYIEARTPKAKIRIKTAERTIEIDCVNPPPLAELVAQAQVLTSG